MKKILILSESLAGGGIERVVLELASGFYNNHYEVHIVLLKNTIEYDIPDYLNIHCLDDSGYVFKISQLKPYIYAHRLRKLLKTIGKFNLTLSNFGSSSTEKILSLVNLDNLYTCVHSIQSKRRFHRHKGNKLRTYLKKRKLRSFYSNKSIITVSAGVQNDLLTNIEIRPKNIITIYNPFDFGIILKMSKEKNDKIPKEKYIIHVGRFELKYKRQDILLKAYKKANIPHKLVLLGQGRDEKNIKNIIKELNIENKVIMPGFYSNPYNWIKNADLFVFSSDYEGFGNVLVESLIVQTPVVSTNCQSGPSEILTGELSNYLVPVGDVDALASKINEALISYPEIKDEYILKFDIDKIISQYISLI